MTKRLGLFLVLFLLLVPIALLAQDPVDNPFGLDEGTLAAILGAFGLGVLGITQLLKQILKVEKWDPRLKDVAGYGLSLVVSAGATAFVLASSDMFTVARFAIYSVGVWGEVNGIWKAIKKASGSGNSG